MLPDAALAMRCGNKIVTRGDPQAKVIKHCGEPTTTTRRFAERAGHYPWRAVYGRGTATQSDPLHRDPYNYRYFRTEVVIEDWLYNLGPNKLMRRITFENGEVRRIETLDRGYRE